MDLKLIRTKQTSNYMKVLLIFTYGVSLEQWFNAGIVFREIEIYKKLLQKNVDISFLTYGNHKDLEYSELMGKIKIIPAQKFIKSTISPIQFLKSLLIPLRFKKQFIEADIIKTNQMRGSLIACIGKLLYGKKIIIRCGYEWLTSFLFLNRPKKNIDYLTYFLKYLWRYFYEFISYHLADGIILTNKRDINFIIKKFKLKKRASWIRCFYNFVDVDLFKPLDLKKKEKYILYIGRLSEEKNLINLFKAFKDLDGFVLDIIGTGVLEEKLKSLAKELGIVVNFLGRFPNNKIPEIMNQYQMFILPSNYEGNPKVLLEAMSCGIPCIGANVYGIKNIIKHKETGYLCKRDSKSIANSIATLYKKKDLREKIGKNAREFILKNCSLDDIAKNEYLLYLEILKK